MGYSYQHDAELIATPPHLHATLYPSSLSQPAAAYPPADRSIYADTNPASYHTHRTQAPLAAFQLPPATPTIADLADQHWPDHALSQTVPDTRGTAEVWMRSRYT